MKINVRSDQFSEVRVQFLMCQQEVQELNDLGYPCQDIQNMLLTAGYHLDMPYHDFEHFFKEYIQHIPEGSFVQSQDLPQQHESSQQDPQPSSHEQQTY